MREQVQIMDAQANDQLVIPPRGKRAYVSISVVRVQNFVVDVQFAGGVMSGGCDAHLGCNSKANPPAPDFCFISSQTTLLGESKMVFTRSIIQHLGSNT
jgi:hypothetical protein